MQSQSLQPHPSISLFVKEIVVLEDVETTGATVLPFYADGYPGLLFQQTDHGLWVQPHNKQMPALFLYGQTIQPIELVMRGSYKIIVFQLYPFVLKSFFNVLPKDLNDNCYDLQQWPNQLGLQTLERLQRQPGLAARLEIITSLLQLLFQQKQQELDHTIALAIKKIISKNGQLTIGELGAAFHLTQRTFERRFLQAVGVTAKQFATIIQFQQSLEQLTHKSHTKMTDIVYANGFADQSHFIKVFKVFTGRTPFAFKAKP